MLLNDNEIINNRYTPTSFISNQKYGEHWKALDRRLERMVELIILDPQYFPDPPSLNIFRLDYQKIAQLDNKHLAQMYDLGSFDSNKLNQQVDYIVTESIELPSIKQLTDQHTSFTPEQSLLVANQLIDVMNSLNLQGIHPELNSDNVFWNQKTQEIKINFPIPQPVTIIPINNESDLISTESKTSIYSLASLIFSVVTGKNFTKSRQIETQAPPEFKEFFTKTLSDGAEKQINNFPELQEEINKINLTSSGVTKKGTRMEDWNILQKRLFILLVGFLIIIALCAGIFFALSRNSSRPDTGRTQTSIPSPTPKPSNPTTSELPPPATNNPTNYPEPEIVPPPLATPKPSPSRVVPPPPTPEPTDPDQESEEEVEEPYYEDDNEDNYNYEEGNSEDDEDDN